MENLKLAEKLVNSQSYDECDGKNEEILKFNERVLRSVEEHSFDIYQRLEFFGHFQRNMVEFLKTRYQKVTNNNTRIKLNTSIAYLYGIATLILNRNITRVTCEPHDVVVQEFMHGLREKKDYIWKEDAVYWLYGNKLLDGQYDFIVYEDTSKYASSPFFSYNRRLYSKRLIIKKVMEELDKEDFFVRFRVIHGDRMQLQPESNMIDEQIESTILDVLKFKECTDPSIVVCETPFFDRAAFRTSNYYEDEYDPFYLIMKRGFNTSFMREMTIFTENDYFDTAFIEQFEEVGILPKRKNLKKEKELLKIPALMQNADWKNPQSVLFETPYVSYDEVLRFIRTYCENPETKFIFMTLYRIEENSPIIRYLTNAAQRGASVFVYIEPMARENEKQNLKIMKILKKNGVLVSNSYYGMKVHAKAFLAIKEDGTGSAHISTGNYDTNRAKTFTDYQFITTDQKVCDELFLFFKALFRREPLLQVLDTFDEKMEHIFISPISLRDRIIHELDTDVCQRVFMKCNSLCDRLIGEKINEAANRGIKISLYCRTACTLIPKRNVRIRSRIGVNLEHGRMYQFDDRFYISSADCAMRNLNKRLELMLRIPDGTIFYDGRHHRDRKLIPTDLEDYTRREFERANWKKVQSKYYMRGNDRGEGI